MLLDLLDMSWETRSSDQNQAKLVNMYLEQDMAKGKYNGRSKDTPIVVAYPMPGLTLFGDTLQSVVRDLYAFNGLVYCVAGNQFGTVDSNGNFSSIGTLSTSSGWAKIRAITGGSDANHQIFIADGTSCYTYNTNTLVFSTPTNTSFVSSINISNGGTGYIAPTIAINDSTGSGATAVVNIDGGVISSILVTSGGSNYSNSPTYVISDSAGTGGAVVINVSQSSCPLTADDIENQDDYIIAKLPNSMEYQISNLSDSTIWDPLNFASKFSQPDNIVGLLSHERMLWLFGDKTTEIWYNSGNINFPFQEVSTTFLHYGLAAKQSIAVNGNYFLMLSANRGGGYSVFQTLPRIYYYNPAPISTPPIDALIKSYSTVSDAIGSIHNWDGHELYHLTFPTGNSTLVYDIPKTQQADQQKGAWYYRTSYANGSYGRFLENCSCFCYGKHLVGDYNSGKIYYLDDSNYTENGTPIQRQFVSPSGPTYSGGKRVFFPRLQIDVETGIGSNNTFLLEKSKDNGGTWTTVGTYTVPDKGGRIYATGLGSSRYGMIFRLTTTMNAKFCILGFQVEAMTGHS